MSTAQNQDDGDIPLPRLRTISQLWTCAALLASVGVAGLALDVPLAAWVRGGNCPDAIQKLCAISEVFGHGFGVVLIVLVIGVLDPWHRYAIPRILAAALGSGLLANVFKLLVARSRPYQFNFQGGGLDTFSNWLPFLSGGSGQQSFPSAHVATATGLAIVLACYYPRGRWLFPAFAALVGCQRVLDHAHFLSDVFWGAAVGCIFAPLCVYGSRLSRAFDRLEERLIVRASTRGHRAQRRTVDSVKQDATPEVDVTRAA